VIALSNHSFLVFHLGNDKRETQISSTQFKGFSEEDNFGILFV